ncbi:MAG: hypothetical protein AAFV69_11015 [Pseudomonadota bacterium]
MMQQPFTNLHFSRRVRRSIREAAATMLLTAAAFGFLMAALYGGGISTMGTNGIGGEFQVTTRDREKSVEGGNVENQPKREPSNLQGTVTPVRN